MYMGFYVYRIIIKICALTLISYNMCVRDMCVRIC